MYTHTKLIFRHLKDIERLEDNIRRLSNVAGQGASISAFRRQIRLAKQSIWIILDDAGL